MKALVARAIRKIAGARPAAVEKVQIASQETPRTIADHETQDYWTDFAVTLHRRFRDAQE